MKIEYKWKILKLYATFQVLEKFKEKEYFNLFYKEKNNQWYYNRYLYSDKFHSEAKLYISDTWRSLDKEQRANLIEFLSKKLGIKEKSTKEYFFKFNHMSKFRLGKMYFYVEKFNLNKVKD